MTDAELRARLLFVHDEVVVLRDEITERVDRPRPWGIGWSTARIYLNRARVALATADREVRSLRDPRDTEANMPPIPREQRRRRRRA